jgi:ankyrin repeat protein
MHISTRRDFFKGPLALAGISVLVPGTVFGAEGASDRDANADTDTPIPPTRRFLDAVARGDETAVRQLLTADPGLLHVRDDAGRSAFAVALLAGHRGVGELLRRGGYAPDLAESALALDWPRFEALAEATPGLVNQDHPVGGTAMYAAALAGAGSQIFRPYVYGGDPNANPRGAEGFTPLRAALEHPDLATAELTAASLLANGGDPNAPQAGGSTPLHAAAARGSVVLVEMLLRKGAVAARRDAGERTPLDLAEEHRHRTVADLLRHPSRVRRDHSTSRLAYDAEGRPFRPADLAAFSVLSRNRLVGAAHFDFEQTRAVVQRHPDLALAVASTDESAVEACAHTGRLPIVDFLLDHGAPYSLPTAVMRHDLPRARALLDEDALRIHERGPHDFALLWYPVIGGGLLEMAELLLERGAEVERQHFLGTTALHYAARQGQPDMVALLLDHGADPERLGRKFATRGDSGDGGATSLGATPLQLAEEQGHGDVVRLLRQRGARR